MVWEQVVSLRPTGGSSCGHTRLTRRAIFVTSGRNPLPVLLMPKALSLRKCKCFTMRLVHLVFSRVLFLGDDEDIANY